MLAQAQQDLRDARLELERARDQIKGRDSHIAQLQQTLAQRDVELTELRAALSQQPSAAALVTAADDLKRIRGIGPGFERVLQAAGINRFEHIAAWTGDDLVRVAGLLNTQPGRIERGGWVQQARELAAQSANIS